MSSQTNPSTPSTTQKARDFLAEPMGDKAVTDLPGIGDKSGGKLADAGIDSASKVYGEYLVAGGNQDTFVETLKDKSDIRDREANTCFKALDEYHKNFS
ncbi:barrier-to-autointegration factor 1-like [Haliotis rufescens]|uniref:barrier-to-autointegration factor 1-like n=1 Tax=Haliotis rufescens TaxID=6454 RepID=UPI00201F5F23|nr:barrier-to-autointegration factor 1-like [Haliotis rufescens]